MQKNGLESKTNCIYFSLLLTLKGYSAQNDIFYFFKKPSIRDEIKPVSHHSYIVYDDNENDRTDGKAWYGYGCDEVNGYSASIAEFQDYDEFLTSNTLAHEIGHSLGMK